MLLNLSDDEQAAQNVSKGANQIRRRSIASVQNLLLYITELSTHNITLFICACMRVFSWLTVRAVLVARAHRLQSPY